MGDEVQRAVENDEKGAAGEIVGARNASLFCVAKVMVMRASWLQKLEANCSAPR